MQRGLSARESSGNVVNHCPEPENRSGFAANEGAGAAGFIFGSTGVLFSRSLVPNFQFEIRPAHLNRKVNATKLMTGRAVLLAVVRPAVERRRFR
jgi:hypothetical protein